MPRPLPAGADWIGRGLYFFVPRLAVHTDQDVVIVGGGDWRGTERWNALEREFAELGVEIVYFSYTHSTSSTRLRDTLDLIHGEGE